MAPNDFGWNGSGENPGPTPPPTTPVAGRAALWTALFVGGAPLWFDHLQREVASLQPGWICSHAPDGVTGLKILALGSVEALVVDSHAPNARELIKAVREERPEIICLIRCEMSDRHEVDSWKDLSVPLVALQADAGALTASLIRSVCLREWTSDPAIKALLPRIRKLPATPELYTQVTKELRNPNGSLEVVAGLISHEPIMSAKLLQLVNSAFFASSREVMTLLDACMILGSERIKALILLAGIFSQYGNDTAFVALVQALLAHSIQVGEFSRAITLKETQDAGAADAAFTAGMLHDVGKLILAGNFPDMFMRMQKLKTSGTLSEREAEWQIYGVSHANLGAVLLAGWGLPLPILEAIAFHHEPEWSSGRTFSLLAAVHVANIFAHGTEPSPTVATSESPRGADLPYLTRIGLGDCLPRWRESCGIGAAKLEDNA